MTTPTVRTLPRALGEGTYGTGSPTTPPHSSTGDADRLAAYMSDEALLAELDRRTTPSP